MSGVLDEDSICIKGGDVITLRNTLVFAVKKGQDSYLDAMRQVYGTALHDIEEEVKRAQQLSRTLSPPSVEEEQRGGKRKGKAKVVQKGPTLKMVYTQARGYHLQMPQWLVDAHRKRRDEVLATESPSTGGGSGQSRPDLLSLQHVVVKGKVAMATTWTLQAASTRQQNAFAEVIRRSSERIQVLLATLRGQYLPFLLRCSDEIALLDLLLSFVHTISTATIPYVRPTLSISSATSLSSCSHPPPARPASPHVVCPEQRIPVPKGQPVHPHWREFEWEVELPPLDWSGDGDGGHRLLCPLSKSDSAGVRGAAGEGGGR